MSPEIEDFVRFNSVSWNDEVAVEYKGQVFLESHFMMADPSFLTSFSFPLPKGYPHSALSQINNVVITESTAKNFSGKRTQLLYRSAIPNGIAVE